MKYIIPKAIIAPQHTAPKIDAEEALLLALELAEGQPNATPAVKAKLGIMAIRQSGWKIVPENAGEG